MKVCISGYYGSRNTGDELLLRAVQKGVRETLGDVEFSALAASPPYVRSLHGINQVAHNTGWQSIGKGELDNPPPISKEAQAILRDSDLLILGGGGLLGHDCVYNYSEVQFCYTHRIPVVALGVGADPFTPIHHHKFRPYFDMLRAVTTRDRWGYSNVINVCDRKTTLVESCADPVFTLYPDQDQTPVNNKVMLVMSTVLRWGQKQDVMIRMWGEVLSQVAEEYDFELVLYPFSPQCTWHDDRKPAKAFQKHAPGKIPIFDSAGTDFMSMIDDFRGCVAVVGDRYHSLILSALVSVPFLGIAHDTKQRNVATQLNQPWLYPENREGRSNIEATFRDLLERPLYWTHQMLDSLAQVKASAHQNFEILNRL